MDAANVVMVIQSVTSLTLLLIAVFWVLPRTRLDAFREQMFAIRSELFDYAASGKIKFDDPAYRLLRQSMNGFIRYAHQLSFFRICMAILIWKTIGEPELEWTTKWRKALASVKDEQVRGELIAFHDRASSLAAERLVLGSPILIGLLILCLIFALFHFGLVSLRSAINKGSTELTSRILDPRLLDEEAARAAA